MSGCDRSRSSPGRLCEHPWSASTIHDGHEGAAGWLVWTGREFQGPKSGKIGSKKRVPHLLFFFDWVWERTGTVGFLEDLDMNKCDDDDDADADDDHDDAFQTSIFWVCIETEMPMMPRNLQVLEPKAHWAIFTVTCSGMSCGRWFWSFASLRFC